jgi:hypothetical protein
MLRKIKTNSIIFFLSFFPWVSFGILKTDTQPYILFLFILAIILKPYVISLNKLVWFIIINIILGLFFSLFDTKNLFTFISFRMIYGAFLFIFALIFYLDYFSRYGYPKKIILIANLIYLFVAIVEYFNPSLLSYLTISRTDIGRGLTSLTPEPSYFGSFLFFCSLSLFIESGFNFKKDLKIHIINIIFIILFAKSSLATMLLVFSFFVFFLFYWDIKKVVKIIIPIIFLITYLPDIFEKLLPETRIGKIINDLYTISFYEIFFYDQSFNQRLEHLVLSLHASFTSFFLPNGVDKFIIKRSLILPYYNGYFWYADETNIIMSWIGDFFFHFGIFGLLPITILMLNIIFTKNKFYTAAFIVFVFSLLTPIPMAFPLTYLLFSQMIYKSFKVEKN